MLLRWGRDAWSLCQEGHPSHRTMKIKSSAAMLIISLRGVRKVALRLSRRSISQGSMLTEYDCAG